MDKHEDDDCYIGFIPHHSIDKNKEMKTNNNENVNVLDSEQKKNVAVGYNGYGKSVHWTKECTLKRNADISQLTEQKCETKICDDVKKDLEDDENLARFDEIFNLKSYISYIGSISETLFVSQHRSNSFSQSNSFYTDDEHYFVVSDEINDMIILFEFNKILNLTQLTIRNTSPTQKIHFFQLDSLADVTLTDIQSLEPNTTFICTSNEEHVVFSNEVFNNPQYIAICIESIQNKNSNDDKNLSGPYHIALYGNVPDVYDIVIESPHGKLTIYELLQFKIEDSKTCRVKGLPPHFINRSDKLMQKTWFGQFGDISMVKFNRYVINASNVCAWITYRNTLSTLNAITFCNNNNIFVDNQYNKKWQLNAKFSPKRYCKYFLLPYTNCENDKCTYVHSWCSKEQFITENYVQRNVNNNNDNEESSLTTQLVDLNKNYQQQQNYIKQLNNSFNLLQQKCNQQQNNFVQQYNLLQQKYNQQQNNITHITNLYNVLNQQYHAKIQSIKSYQTRCTILEETMNDQEGVNNDNIQSIDIINNKWQTTHKATLQKCNLQSQTINLLRNEINGYKAMNNELLANLRQNNNEQKNDDDIDKCKQKFEIWLCQVVNLKKYLANFEQNEYNDITMIEFFDNSVLEEIGIQNKLHCKKIMKYVAIFQTMVKEFNNWMDENKNIKKYKVILLKLGIVTLEDLKVTMKTKTYLKHMFKINNDNQVDMIWNAIHDV